MGCVMYGRWIFRLKAEATDARSGFRLQPEGGNDATSLLGLARCTRELTKDLQLFRRKIFLPRTLIQLPETVMRLCQVRLKARGAAQDLNGLRVSLLISKQNAQLKKPFRERRVEHDRASEQRFNPLQLSWLRR